MNWLIYLNDLSSIIAILINIKLYRLLDKPITSENDLVEIYKPILLIILTSCIFDLLIELLFLFGLNDRLVRDLYSLIFPIGCFLYFLKEKFGFAKNKNALILLLLLASGSSFFGNYLYQTLSFGIIGFSMISFVLVVYLKNKKSMVLNDYFIFWVGLILVVQYIIRYFIDPNFFKSNKLISFAISILNFYLQNLFRFFPAFYFYAIRKYNN